LSEKTRELVECDCCASMVWKEDAVLVKVKIGESTAQLMICIRCISRELEAPDKYVMKDYKEEDFTTSIRELRVMIDEVRGLLFMPQKIALKRDQDLDEIRGQAIDKIINAIIEVEKVVKSAKVETEKSKPDASKARYYHLLGYLVQVLDCLLRSTEPSELDSRLKAAEALLDELERSRTRKQPTE